MTLYYLPEVFRSEISSCILKKYSEEQLVKYDANGKEQTEKKNPKPKPITKKPQTVKNSEERLFTKNNTYIYFQVFFILKLLAKSNRFKEVPLRLHWPSRDFCSESDFNENAELSAYGKTVA